MPKTQKSFRLDDSTLWKLEILRDRYDSYTKALAVAIHHLYMSEVRLQKGAKMDITIKFSDDGLYGHVDPESENINEILSAVQYAEMTRAALKAAYPAATVEMIHGISDSHAVDGQEEHNECGWIGEIIHDVWRSWKWIVKYPTP